LGTSDGLCERPGIGKSLATKLAEQGIDVVLVALDDGLLEATFSELKAQFPGQTFRKAGHPAHACSS
jgi:short-subunit dehydrogenase